MCGLLLIIALVVVVAVITFIGLWRYDTIKWQEFDNEYGEAIGELRSKISEYNQLSGGYFFNRACGISESINPVYEEAQRDLEEIMAEQPIIHERSYYRLAAMYAAIATFIVGISIWAAVYQAIYPNDAQRVTFTVRTQEIVALGDSQSVEGHANLFSVKIEGVWYYRYYTEENGVLTPDQLRQDSVILREDSPGGAYVQYEKTYWDGNPETYSKLKDWYFFVPAPAPAQPQYTPYGNIITIHVPPGTVRRDFNIDLD